MDGGSDVTPALRRLHDGHLKDPQDVVHHNITSEHHHRALATVCNSWPAAGIQTFHSNSEPVSLVDNYSLYRRWVLGTR